MTYQSNPNATVIPTAKWTGAFSGATISAGHAQVINKTTLNTKMTVQNVQNPPPAGWRTYNSQIGDDIYESPAHGRATYLSSLNIGNRMGRFHWNVFYQQNPEIKHLFTGVSDAKGANMVTICGAMFLDPIEHARFEEWLVEYQAKFGSRDNLYSHYFPAPPSRLSNLLPIQWVQDQDLVEVAIWIERQCIDQVYAVGEMFFFQNEEDAIAYKLKFS